MFILTVKYGEKLIDNIVFEHIWQATFAAKILTFVNQSYSMAISDNEGNIIYTY